MLLGAVIAGGAARRFGSDKAAAPWQGAPLLDHAIAALAGRCRDVVICGREWPGRRSLDDRPSPGFGPLGGIAAALHEAQALGLDAVLTAACDMPDLPCDLLDRLVSTAPAFAEEAPILGCWPVALAAPLDQHLAAGGDRSIRRWARKSGAFGIPSAPLLNINHPADLPP